MTLSGSKSVKKGQKMLKKATNWTYTWFFKKEIACANLIHINSYNIGEKSVMSLYDFRTYFFPLGEVEVSFSNLLTRANNYRKFLSVFFSKKVTWHCPLACRNTQKIAHFMY